MPTFIRLTDYKSSDAKEEGFFKPENQFIVQQDAFSKIPGMPIAYWNNEIIFTIFEHSMKLKEISPARRGLETGNNEKYLRYWHEITNNSFYKNIDSTELAKKENVTWVPHNKGGVVQKWYGNNDYVVFFKDDGEAIKKSGNLNGYKYYFNKGITWTALTTNINTFRYSNIGFLFDSNKGPMIFEKDAAKLKYLLAFFNTKVAQYFMKLLNPTLSLQNGDMDKLPIILEESNSIKQQIDQLTQQNIDISRQEWDSRETSWDFTQNELLKHKQDGSLENALTAYHTYWREQFKTLHSNEEELNRLFIGIYGLQDELTPNVALEDITILKSETKIVNDKLEFQNDEIIRQFISYGVGVMFGRYSLDSDGLLIANMDQEIPLGTTYEIDNDNIIPIVDESDYFADDITGRFIEFMRITFGSEKLQQNIAFIEKAIGKKVRTYFVKDFVKDHIKRYKKRPIYWLFSSPKGTFQTLIYMHRYTPDTLNHILNDYLRPFRIRLDTMRNEAMRTTEREDVSSKEKTDADKKIDKIDKTLDDINEYEKVLAHYAAQRIEIDLDDGVKVNYCKFKELLFEFDKKLCK